MDIIGYDKNNKPLKVGDKCGFWISMGEFTNGFIYKEGTILYDKEDFIYYFESSEDKSTCFMMEVEPNSIEKL